jgi:PAS domain S-box-containing protein
MNAADRSELLQVLQRRCDTIADRWYQAIAGTSQMSHSAAEVRQHLAQLTEQAIALLLANPLEDGRAEAIGASLARLHYTDPEVLGRTQELLAQQFVEGLPADQVVALQPRLATLLGGLATGFSQQTREAILAQQEQITEELRQEIAERRQAEKALRESEERFQQVAENAQEWIWEVDARGLYTYASPAVEKILGYKPEEIVGKKHFHDLFHPEDQEELKEAAFEVFAQKQSFREFINRNVRQDGQTVWLSTGGVPILDEEGNLLGYRGADTDITERRWVEEALRKAHEGLERRVEERTAELTIANEQLKREIEERKRAEEALRESEDTARVLLNAPTDIAALIDTRGIILDANETMASRFRRRVDELVGSCVWDLFPPEVSEHRKAHINEVIQSDRPVRFEDEREGMWNDNVIYPILDAQGKVRKIAILARDITERKRAEEELRHYTERMRQLARQVVSTQEEERQRLSRALHDEAGQALTALRISLELIQEDLPAESSSLHQRIGDAAALTGATMEQIRLLAQDLRPPALDTVGLNPTLEGFCGDFAERTRLSIEYLGLELPMLPEPVNMCLYRFLQEALTNVAKHARANQVRVALRYDAETVSLSVEDDGRGFDRQARMSERCWPMGIGLLGMQERLESLGGRLEIESQPGQGTRLVAHLPVGGTP